MSNRKPPPWQYHCSFCSKSQEQVHRLIAGPGGVYICDNCVALCQGILAEEQTNPAASQTADGGQSGERSWEAFVQDRELFRLYAEVVRLEAENSALREQLRGTTRPQ